MDNRITRSFPSKEKGNRQSDYWLAERMAPGRLQPPHGRQQGGTDQTRRGAGGSQSLDTRQSPQLGGLFYWRE